MHESNRSTFALPAASSQDVLTSILRAILADAGCSSSADRLLFAPRMKKAQGLQPLGLS